MNDTCLEIFYYFLGAAKTKLEIYVYSEDQQVCDIQAAKLLFTTLLPLPHDPTEAMCDS